MGAVHCTCSSLASGRAGLSQVGALKPRLKYRGARLAACEARSEKGRTSRLVGLRREPHAILEGLINITWMIHFALPPAGEAAG